MGRRDSGTGGWGRRRLGRRPGAFQGRGSGKVRDSDRDRDRDIEGMGRRRRSVRHADGEKVLSSFSFGKMSSVTGEK